MHQPIEPVAHDLAALEADTRRLMAQHAAINPRGWTTQRERADLHARIDNRLDAWNALSALADDLETL